jgi:hypothetical protein
MSLLLHTNVAAAERSVQKEEESTLQGADRQLADHHLRTASTKVNPSLPHNHCLGLDPNLNCHVVAMYVRSNFDFRSFIDEAEQKKCRRKEWPQRKRKDTGTLSSLMSVA